MLANEPRITNRSACDHREDLARDGPETEFDRLVNDLNCVAAYDERTSTVERCETHISVVFLTDTHAYKLKKRVTLPFLDFSTLARRKLMCEAECRLNQRLAPHIYLGIEPVTWDGQRYRIGGQGEIADYVVKMVRLPVEQNLVRMIVTNSVARPQLDRLVERLVAFYKQQPICDLTVDQYLSRLRQNIDDNFTSLSELCDNSDRTIIRRVYGSQVQLLATSLPLFRSRVEGGWIREGHGDLRPEHIYLGPEPTVVDCLEFNQEFRQIDLLDELAFLEMECDCLGAYRVGRWITNRVGSILHDDQPRRLRQFYKSYRASVRAKVAAIRAHQRSCPLAIHARLASDYLRLADRYVRDFAQPVVIVVRGLMGTGKTTLATALTREIGATHLSTDRIRRELYKTSNVRHDYGRGIYSENARRHVYDTTLKRARDLLANRMTVVIDGSFISRWASEQVRAMCVEYDASLIVLECRCPRDVALARISERMAIGTDASEARPDLYDEQQSELERERPTLPIQTIDTSSSTKVALDQALAAIRASISCGCDGAWRGHGLCS